MTLKKYVEKRSFDKTSEPSARTASKSKSLPRFCIQKHAATRLHYDFRLEHKGVLLSWAVPKGPSVDPKQKHLAIQVEDHPFEYRHFEGVIPKGNYGAGTVMIWDEGTYSVPGATTKKAIENAVVDGLEHGHLEFELFGEKLQGLWVLIRFHTDDGKKNWLFFKKKDQYAFTDADVTALDKSVRTNRTMKQISDNN